MWNRFLWVETERNKKVSKKKGLFQARLTSLRVFFFGCVCVEGGGDTFMSLTRVGVCLEVVCVCV